MMQASKAINQRCGSEATVRTIRNTSRLFLVLFLFVLSVSWATAGNGPQDAKAADKKAAATKPMQAPKATVDPAKYVGTDTCKGCHEEEFKSYESSAHYSTALNKKRSPDVQGCEGCHGPGKEHAENPGEKGNVFAFSHDTPSAQLSERCLGCHAEGGTHANFQRAMHNSNSVSCIDCHSPHKPKVKEALLKLPQPLLCYGCHQDKKTDFAKPFHHRVNEGLVKCSDCHNPHGGFLTKQMNTTNGQDQVCFKCHAEKAGPFVFEHAPVKTEGCVTCHSPHGSPNPRLLRRANVNLLCMECHTLTVDSLAPAVPTFHNQATKYQACTMCHTQIHGSNFSVVFFK